MTATGTAPAPQWAVTASRLFQPAHSVPVGVTLAATYGGHGRWGYVILAITLCALLPVAFVLLLERLHLVSSRRVHQRTARLHVMTGLIIIEALGVTTLHATGAPTTLTVLMASTLVGIITLALVTPVVRASVHTAVITVIAGAVAPIALPTAAALAMLAGVVGVARIASLEHTRTQVVVGWVWGLAAGFATPLLLG